MSTMGQTGGQHSTELADELHDREAQEAALERRTRSLELGGPLTLVFSMFALALSIGAFIVALSHDSNGTTGPAHMMGTGTTSAGTTSGMMSGTGGQGQFSSAMMAAAGRGTIHVQLGDYWVQPAVASVRAGKVTFIARNVGRVPHELMVERMPIRFDSPMHPTEDAAQGMIEDMDAGRGGRMTMNLRPGTYLLFCNVSGHYAAGQHTAFRVTGS